MTSEVTINGRSIAGWRKWAILVPAFLSAMVVCALTWLALIPLAVFFVIFLLPVALLVAVLKHD